MSASYYLTAMFNNCIPQQQLGSCSVTSPYLSLRRVWLVWLANYKGLGGHSLMPCSHNFNCGQSVVSHQNGFFSGLSMVKVP